MPFSITDPMQVPSYRNTAFQRFLEGLLYDPRDVVFLRMTLKIFAIQIPLLVSMFVQFHWWVLLAYLLIGGWYISPVILMLHNTMHRPFIKKYRSLNKLHTYSLSLLFGIPMGYMEHHVGMHHVENNVGEDLSATLKYERDSFLHWLHYFVKFMFTTTIELPIYLRRKKRDNMARTARITGILQGTLVIASTIYDPRIGLAAFAFPWFITRFAMMFGNWGQHAFIDPSRPGDSLVNSITCINSMYNQRCFNDGYHIGHHVKPNRHWADLPKDFIDNAEEYGKAGCIVFSGIDFFVVSLLLFTKRYDILAKKFVPLDGRREWTQEQIITFLKSRTRPVEQIAASTDVVNAAA